MCRYILSLAKEAIHGGRLMGCKILNLILIFTLSTTAFAVNPALSKSKTPQENLNEAEGKMDKKILEINKSLGTYHVLKEVKLEYLPQQTEVIKGDEGGFSTIKLISYDFIPLGYSGKSVGHKEKYVKLFFKGETLEKIETKVLEQNFREDTRYTSKVEDPKPSTEKMDDLVVVTQFNREDTYKVELKDMDNTLANPHRLKFKRDYYIPHLTHFEKLFRYTLAYQKFFGRGSDKVTIERLKRSLNY